MNEGNGYVLEYSNDRRVSTLTPHSILYVAEAAGRRRIARQLDAFWNPTHGPLLNLGCGDDLRPGWTNVDKYSTRDGVVRFDVGERWPLPDESYGGILANQVLEHLPTDTNRDGRDRLINALCEASRVLRPGGKIVVGVPTGAWSWSNATHYRAFDKRTLHSVLGTERHTNHSQGKPDLMIVKTLTLRTLEVGRFFNSSYHCPKYLGLDPNIGRRRWLYILLRKPD